MKLGIFHIIGTDFEAQTVSLHSGLVWLTRIFSWLWSPKNTKQMWSVEGARYSKTKLNRILPRPVLPISFIFRIRYRCIETNMQVEQLKPIEASLPPLHRVTPTLGVSHMNSSSLTSHFFILYLYLKPNKSFCSPNTVNLNQKRTLVDSKCMEKRCCIAKFTVLGNELNHC